MLIDSHAHLNDQRLARELPKYLQAAKAAGVTQIINVGYDFPSSQLAVNQAQNYGGIFAAVGLHPHDARHWSDEVAAQFELLARNQKVVAYGEIGLDFHYDHSPRDIQRKVFREQLHIAKHLGLPVIIHDREAHQEVLRILQESAPYPAGGVMHCYSASAEMLKSFLDLNFFISLAGPVTFKNARRLTEVAEVVPAERLLVETDCPYLTPEPYRGKLNHPALVSEVVRKIAGIRKQSYEAVSQQTVLNSRRLFRLPEEEEIVPELS